MSSLFRGPPGVQGPPPPPPPPPAPPTMDAGLEAAGESRRRAVGAKGLNATIATTPQGLVPPPDRALKSLLG